MKIGFKKDEISFVFEISTVLLYFCDREGNTETENWKLKIENYIYILKFPAPSFTAKFSL